MEHKFNVTDGDTFEVDGIEFRVQVHWQRDLHASICIDGGYGKADYEDGTSSWMEMDGDYEIKTIDLPAGIDDGDYEFEVTITDADLAKVRQYRNEYPLDTDEADKEDRQIKSDLDTIMTAGEAVEAFGLSADAVNLACRRGSIPARKSGGTWLIRRADAVRRWGHKTHYRGFGEFKFNIGDTATHRGFGMPESSATKVVVLERYEQLAQTDGGHNVPSEFYYAHTYLVREVESGRSDQPYEVDECVLHGVEHDRN